ncbi:FAD-dependent oxidoreductase [Wenzhouxiangella sp. XN24]|uniref:glycerol-3-phosphate dehydrogenase/oxidase n=1 Tax=Wenzhouxiangella sp. XN24 TaxID=2713569 RepID=UPI0013EDACB4|nr:FAD-dependent oxidoreductase [Wenzhouxiangella sp. XN24]NGX16862.1 FAD-dependent oxidoreductase [Wenzhouxiangella sp. XN24]
MQRDLDAFSGEFDVLVVGAGIHGACIARLAAQAGLRVALIERGDFGVATSRNSAKLVHGGLRYIQNFDIPRIRESVVSQRTWFRFAPHLMRPLRFVMPTYGFGTRSPLALGGGMLAYHLSAIGRNSGIPQSIRLPGSGVMTRGRLVGLHPLLQRKDVTGGAFWYDGQMHDAVRVTLECIWDAVDAGAVAANHLGAESLLHDAGGVRGVVARDQITGREVEVRAKVTLNATGPWVDEFLARGPAALRGVRITAWTRNINLVTRALYPGEDALGIASRRPAGAAIGQPKRLFFTSPWHGCTVVGTTHDLHESPADELSAPSDVIETFVGEVNAAAPGLGLELDDIRAVHIGLTPTEDSETNRAKRSIVIDHAETQGVDGLISVAGIKYTTAPLVAGRVVRQVCRKLGRPVTLPSFSEPAGGAPVLAADADGCSGFGAGDEHGWASMVYGSRALTCLGDVSSGCLGNDEVFRRRVKFGIEQEMVVRLSDAVLRATDWAERGLLSADLLEWCADHMAKSLGWSAERMAAESTDTLRLLERFRMGVRTAPVTSGTSADRVVA